MHKLLAFLLAFIVTALIVIPGAGAAGDMTEIKGMLTRKIKLQAEYPDNPVIAGESSTTGLPFNGTYVPILVVIDDAEEALPQWGIGNADIMYQMPNGGSGSTKLLALFTDTIPETAGGVRSARVPFVDLRESWDAVFIYCGGPASMEQRLKKFGVKSKVLHFDLIGTAGKYGTRVDYHKSPHNMAATLPAIKNTFLQSGRTVRERPFLFTDTTSSTDISASYIEIAHFGKTAKKGTGNPASWASYTFDKSTNTYLRATLKSPYVDYFNQNTQLSYSNVIVQRTKFSHNGNYVFLKGIVGSGAADIFMGGQYIAGSWFRKSIDSRTVFLDENGNELALLRGKSFIIVTNDVTKVIYSK